METKATNNIRCLAVDTVQKANSGHPGAPMGMAPISTLLWGEAMTFDPAAPEWQNRDRFVLSNGHASALIYSMLHLCGYKVSTDDLKQFRQLGSITPGHPERHVTPGVEVTTGPLGQGISNAVGMAMAEAHLAATFNKPDATIVDHKTWVFCGDGCLMEGVAQEALSLAGHLALEKLCIIYDDNKITIDGATDVAYTEKCVEKYQALGFRTIVVENGDEDYAAMRAALAEAQTPCGKPTMILLRTTIGMHAKLAGTAKVHGAPLGAEDIGALKTRYGRNPEEHFAVDEDVYAYFQGAGKRGAEKRAEWEKAVAAFRAKYPEEAAKYDAYWTGSMPAGWQEALPRNSKAVATRKASENALAEIMARAPFVVGGSADLTGSNLTRPGDAKLVDFQKESPAGRYIRFGVREHGMTGVLNGIDAHGGLVGFGATFLNFVSYAMGSLRLSAMSEHGIIMVATHDSIGLGEDGPTHQPIETLAALRALPNLIVLRPSDQTETSAAWAIAIERRKTPTVLCLSRQAVAPIAASSFEGTKKGAYTVVEAASPKLIIVSSGTEVSLAVDAAKETGVATAVVSMPSWELFAQQDAAYKASVFPAGVPVLSVEPYSSFGWERYSHAHCGLESWGASAPAPALYEHFGLTPAAVAAKGKKLVEHFAGSAPVLGHSRL
jgi:transketolase